MTNIYTIELKLENLRKLYKNASLEKRKIILMQARLLEIAKEKAQKNKKTLV